MKHLNTNVNIHYDLLYPDVMIDIPTSLNMLKVALIYLVNGQTVQNGSGQ